jgi:hypothetical protein
LLEQKSSASALLEDADVTIQGTREATKPSSSSPTSSKEWQCEKVAMSNPFKPVDLTFPAASLHGWNVEEWSNLPSGRILL